MSSATAAAIANAIAANSRRFSISTDPKITAQPGATCINKSIGAKTAELKELSTVVDSAADIFVGLIFRDKFRGAWMYCSTCYSVQAPETARAIHT